MSTTFNLTHTPYSPTDLKISVNRTDLSKKMIMLDTVTNDRCVMFTVLWEYSEMGIK